MLKALILDVLKCFIITATIEVIGGYVLKIRSKKSLINILIANIITNPLIVSIILYFNLHGNIFERNVMLFLLEIIVVLIEGFIYKKYKVYTKKINPYILSLLLNITSYFAGLIVRL